MAGKFIHWPIKPLQLSTFIAKEPSFGLDFMNPGSPNGHHVLLRKVYHHPKGTSPYF